LNPRGLQDTVINPMPYTSHLWMVYTSHLWLLWLLWMCYYWVDHIGYFSKKILQAGYTNIYKPLLWLEYGSVSKPCTPGEHQNSW
jgi:hypothetical protein